jgi:hypothetical protein
MVGFGGATTQVNSDALTPRQPTARREVCGCALVQAQLPISPVGLEVGVQPSLVTREFRKTGRRISP